MSKRRRPVMRYVGPTLEDFRQGIERGVWFRFPSRENLMELIWNSGIINHVREKVWAAHGFKSIHDGGNGGPGWPKMFEFYDALIESNGEITYAELLELAEKGELPKPKWGPSK